MNELTLFDYGQLDIDDHIVVRQRTEEIRALIRRSAQDIIDIGNKLIDVKARLGHGNFGKWLESEFGWTDRTARQFMAVSEKFKSENFSDLSIGASALYLLAASSTPEAARIEAIERSRAGEEITHAAAKAIVAQHRTSAAPPGGAASEYEEIANDIEENGYEWSRSELAEYNDATEEEMREAERELVREYRKMAQEERKMAPAPTALADDGDEYYTPDYILEPARRVLGCIDVDPASCASASEVVKAFTYFDKAANGLLRQWNGNVWLNPPYSNPLPWIEKLFAEYAARRVTAALVLVNTANSPQWARLLWQSDSSVCLLSQRIKFWRVDRREGKGFDRDQMIWYIGANHAKFRRVFEEFGAVR